MDGRQEGPRGPRLVTRRHFLYLSAASVAGLAVAACGGEAPATSTTAVQATTAGQQPTAASQPTTAAPQPTTAGQPTAAATQAAAAKAYKEAPVLA